MCGLCFSCLAGCGVANLSKDLNIFVVLVYPNKIPSHVFLDITHIHLVTKINKNLIGKPSNNNNKAFF